MKYDQISRVFTTSRNYVTKEGENKVFVQEYDCTTRSYIYDPPDEAPALLENVFGFLERLMRIGRPEIEERKSVSSGPLMRGVHTKKVSHPILESIRLCEYEGKGPDQHRTVQKHLMRFEPAVIASEVPVWDNYWMGHIDELWWDKATSELWVLDFKPDADKEKKAASQVFRYIHLLAEHLEIDPRLIKGGYFDKKSFYQVIF